ncbi:winged helix-turn-helix transcriptional regulator [Lactiplantibacillus plantarum]|nr:winged helix-turn-helix transcriptional regulator [Lactiplantibacillus plantarum]
MEIQETGRKISHLNQLFLHNYINLENEIHVSVIDYNVFLTIQENPGCSQLFLANKRNVQRSLLTRIVKKYVEMGLIERRGSKYNKSAYALFLTETGEKVTQKIRHKIFEINEKIYNSCSSDQYQQLNEILDIIITHWNS